MRNTARAVRPATGRPLLALAGILICWTAARVAVWEAPKSPPSLGQRRAPAIELASVRGVRDSSLKDAIFTVAHNRPADVALGRISLNDMRMRGANAGYAGPRALTPLPRSWRVLSGGAPDILQPSRQVEPAPSTRIAPLPSPPAQMQALPVRRWSGDAWLLWRSGSQALAGAGPISPTYGGSQAGAVLLHDLAPGSTLRPSAYVRTVQALERRRDGDLAAGLAVRPLPGVPVTAHGEARLSRRGDAVTLRPAAFVSGGVDALPVGAGISARGYAQSGYVGGRDATAFADGSLIAERRLWGGRDAVLTTGVGAWGGAQRGAARLDLGPAASLRFRLGEGTARLSADYRLRVVGNAEPAAGAAFTLSAGF